MKQYIMSSLKKALQAYLVILPFAVIGGITVGIYMIEHSAPEIIEASIAQLGSEQALVAVATMQSLIYSLFAWVVGYFIVDRLGLIKPFRFETTVLKKVCPIIVLLGLLFAADYFVMGRMIPEVAADYEKGISVAYFISSLTYGGVIEEILLRWFFMGLIALILVMLFARKTDKNEIPDWIFITANIIAALVFFGRSSACNTDVFWKNHRFDPDSLFSSEWCICPVFWKMVSQVWYPVCNVRTFRNSFHIKNYIDLCVIIYKELL